MANIEQGIFELIGINEQVDQNRYAASVVAAISGGPIDGIITSVALFRTQDGSGQLRIPSGRLLILDADPAISAGDASITNAEHLTILGRIDISNRDWHEDSNGLHWFGQVKIPFHSLSSLYFAFFNSGDSINDSAGDDEQLECNFWYDSDIIGDELEASSAKTVTGQTVDQTVQGHRGVELYLDLTVVSGTSPTLDIDVEVKDPSSGKYFTLASFPQQTAAGTAKLTIYPGINHAANTYESKPLARIYRAKWTIAGTSPSFTFSLGRHRLP